MSEYTPTTEEVRDSYDYQFTLGMNDISQIAEFDRWLAQVKAQVWDEGFDGGVDHCVLKQNVFNPYREETE